MSLTNKSDGLQFGKTRIDLVIGNVARLKFKVDVIINSTNKELHLAMGPNSVSEHIRLAAGRGLQKEVKRKYPNGIQLGEVAITNCYNLRCERICHGAVPGWVGGWASELAMMETFIDNCMREADKRGFKSIAFPAIGVGHLNYPKESVADTMYKIASNYGSASQSSNITNVYFVVDIHTASAFENAQKKYKIDATTKRNNKIDTKTKRNQKTDTTTKQIRTRNTEFPRKSSDDTFTDTPRSKTSLISSTAANSITTTKPPEGLTAYVYIFIAAMVLIFIVLFIVVLVKRKKIKSVYDGLISKPEARHNPYDSIGPKTDQPVREYAVILEDIDTYTFPKDSPYSYPYYDKISTGNDSTVMKTVRENDSQSMDNCNVSYCRTNWVDKDLTQVKTATENDDRKEIYHTSIPRTQKRTLEVTPKGIDINTNDSNKHTPTYQADSLDSYCEVFYVSTDSNHGTKQMPIPESASVYSKARLSSETDLKTINTIDEGNERHVSGSSDYVF